MSKRYFAGDIIEILNVDKLEWELGEPANRMIGARYYLFRVIYYNNEGHKYESFTIETFTNRGIVGDRKIDLRLERSHFRLYHRPFKNKIRAWKMYLKHGMTDWLFI